jgi:NDP-sugar pyrophosphorylase family protein
MGCCATRVNNNRNQAERTNKPPIAVNTDTSVTDDLPSELEDEDFVDHVTKLKRIYGFSKYQSFWVGIGDPENLNKVQYF